MKRSRRFIPYQWTSHKEEPASVAEQEPEVLVPNGERNNKPEYPLSTYRVSSVTTDKVVMGMMERGGEEFAYVLSCHLESIYAHLVSLHPECTKNLTIARVAANELCRFANTILISSMRSFGLLCAALVAVEECRRSPTGLKFTLHMEFSREASVTSMRSVVVDTEEHELVYS